MVLLDSKNLRMGMEAVDFSLEATDGLCYSLADFTDAEVLVVIFMCNHCPYVQAVWGRLVALQKNFTEKGVRFVGINPNLNPRYPEETMEKMKEYYSRYEMNFPYLQDANQEVAKVYGAVCTPEVFVYERKLGNCDASRCEEIENPHLQATSSGESVMSVCVDSAKAKGWFLAYHGRIDDNWQEENLVQKQDLREAIETILRGEKCAETQVPSMGCSIKWRE